ncbi:MAG: DUF1194 domain-containing protein [Acetobacterales bacterium]
MDLEILLAVDISDSVQPDEAQLQRDGYLAAIASQQIIDAIQQGELGRIALAYMEWADAHNQRVVVDWTVIADADDARGFVDLLAEQPIGSGFHTSISAAIDVGVGLIEDNGFEGKRRIIDISGDGRSNKGRPLADARADAIARGITINGLPVSGYSRLARSRVPPEYLEEYYRDEVIGGPGAFMVVAENFEDFVTAIHRKLLKEIADAGDEGDTLAGAGGF